jgi:hypothetical protein
LHIEIAERHGVRHRLGSAFFTRNEVELIVDAPIVFHRIYRAVLEDQLRVAGGLAREEKIGGGEWDN